MSTDHDERTGTQAQAQAMAERTDKRLHEFKSAAARREGAASGIFAEIETALAAILATPLLQHDEHCQNLITRIAHAGTMEDFALRVADLERHIRRLSGQPVDVEADSDPIGGYLVPSQARRAHGSGELNMVAERDGVARPVLRRTRLQL